MASIAKLTSIALAFLAGSSRTSTLDREQIPFRPNNPSSINSIPSLGFGTWRLDKFNASDAVSVALQTGYRHIDCAAIYGNEKEVGNGIKDGLETIGLDRSSVWITSKLWNDQYALNVACYHTIFLTQFTIVATRLIRLSKGSIRR